MPVSEFVTFSLAATLCAMAVFQRRDGRQFSASVFAVAGMLHIAAFYWYQLAFSDAMGGLVYFVTDVAVISASIAVMLRSQRIAGLTVILIRISFYMMVVDAVALALWRNGLYPEVNTYLFVALRIWAIIAMYRPDGSHEPVGGIAVNNWRGVSRLLFGSWVLPGKRGERTA